MTDATPKVELPEMPPALEQVLTDYRCGDGSRVDVDAAIRAYATQAVLKERDRAARIAESSFIDGDSERGQVASEIAAAIRAG